MPAKVTLCITKGIGSGECYSYPEKEVLILGRDKECGIVLDEPTVSRYHCMIEIHPPSANIKDFGSGNGIKLNGETIAEGRFRSGLSIDEARDRDVSESKLKDGDVIALSSMCELSVKVFVPEYCAECLCELEEGDEGLYQNDDGVNICRACYELLVEEREAAREAEEAAREAEAAAAEAERIRLEKAKQDERARLAKMRRDAMAEAKEARLKCIVCGDRLPTGMADGDAQICPKCQRAPLALLDFMLELMGGGSVPEDIEVKGYRKIRMLGRGGMGAVFEVEEEATGSHFALKLMLATKNAEAHARASFLREASIGVQLNHPHIVRHFKYGNSGDTYYVLQEICGGGSVDKLMERSGGRLPLSMATEITLQILDALIFAHNKEIEVDLADGSEAIYKGIIHRDIKPGNFFLMATSGPPVAKLADFGLAKAFEAAGLTEFTRTGDAQGSPWFMPRQQIIKFKYAKPDVDVWAVAASYYQMLTGSFPKDFNAKKDPWSEALKNPAVPIRKRDRNIGKRLAEVIDQALIEKPAIGFSTALELKKALEGAI